MSASRDISVGPRKVAERHGPDEATADHGEPLSISPCVVLRRNPCELYRMAPGASSLSKTDFVMRLKLRLFAELERRPPDATRRLINGQRVCAGNSRRPFGAAGSRKHDRRKMQQDDRFLRRESMASTKGWSAIVRTPVNAFSGCGVKSIAPSDA